MSTQTNNVKSKQVRHAVMEGLKSLSMSYKKYLNPMDKGKTPPNGLVMLAGSILNRYSLSGDQIPWYV
jgi:peptide subunit release factor 1 (eRF1)